MATNEDLAQLRHSFDGDDPFMGNPQIIVVRKRPKIVPEWTMNDKMTREVINRSFPNWRNNKIQLKRASRWAQVVVLYFRQDLPHNQVAEEMGIGYNALKMLIRNVRCAGLGKRANGTGLRSDTLRTTLEADLKQGPNEALTSTSLHRTDQGSGGDSRAPSSQEVSLQEESHR